jgi:hypothetical protein
MLNFTHKPMTCPTEQQTLTTTSCRKYPFQNIRSTRGFTT